MRNWILPFLFFSVFAIADTPPARTVNSETYDGAGNAITSTVSGGDRGLDVYLLNSSVPVTQSGTWNLSNVSGTISLPTGAATSAKQDTGNTSLSSIDGKLNSLGQKTSAASVPVVIASDQTVTVTGTISTTNAANGTPGSAAPSQATQVGGSDGTNLRAVKVSSTGVVSVDGSAVTQPVSGTFWQATQPVSAASLPLPSGASTSANQSTEITSLSSIDGKLPALVSGRIPVDGSAVTQPVSGTFWQATQPVSGTVAATQSGTWNITNVSGTVSLPTGAATAAKQPALGTAGTASADVITVQGIASMTALKVDGSGVTQPVSGTVAATQSGTWTVQPGNTANTTAWKVDGSAVTQPVSAASLPLPSGASTSANQTTEIASLASIDGKLNSLGQKVMTASVPVVIASDQSAVTVSGSVTATPPVNANATLSARQTVTTTESNLSAPSNAVGVILECESVNADNLRWGFSNATGAILSSTLGMLCEPGRDSGYLPLGTGTKLHMIATGAGSNFIDVQWVLSQ